MKLLFVDDLSPLSVSKKFAPNRFLALGRQLTKTTTVKVQYVEFIKEYESLGHISRIGPNNLLAADNFIPHHCMLKHDCSTSRFLVVFNASTKMSTGISLNDIMSNEPTVQSELCTILLRFRLSKFMLKRMAHIHTSTG